MCGILGGNCRQWDYDAGLEAMHYRGPNGKRIKEYDNFVLGFVRLAIRDLSDLAMQPMISADNQVAVVFNGELYGIENLRNELERKYEFKTSSDTEVLLNLYLEYGDGFIEKIDGMFAIAIYDRRKDIVTLYRDRVGIKPLYYLYDGTDFCFSSELKGITQTCRNRSYEYDLTALYDFFSYEYIPEPKTMYKNVFKLEPAHKVVFHIAERQLEVPQRYWSLTVNPYEGITRDKREICQEARRIISGEIKNQLVSDVEVGTFLSGGIDSSIVTAVANEVAGDKLKAFSIGFEVDEERYRHYDERQYAKMLADKYEIDLISEIFPKEKLKEIYPNIAQWYTEPYAAHSCYPTYFVSELVKNNGVTVVLTGDGGDEIFGGYTRYEKFKQQMQKRSTRKKRFSNVFYQYVYGSARRRFAEYFLEDIALYGLEVDWCHYKNQRQILSDMGIVVPKDYDDFWYFRKYDNKELPPITRAQVIDFNTYLPSACLQKVDRATMQCSIEARVPLCGKEVIEFAFSLTEDERCMGGDLKGVLKCTYSEEIPHDILYKCKKGFTFPPRYGDVCVGNRLEYRTEIAKIFLSDTK